MALYVGRICAKTPRITPLLAILSPRVYSKFEVDVMDEFTSQLMQRKIGNWDLKKRKNEALMERTSTKNEEKPQENTHISDLTQEKLNFLFRNLLESENVESMINLVDLCLEHNKSPPANTVISLLAICSQQGDKSTIIKIQNLCRKHHPSLLLENSEFRHFLAEAVWIGGDVSKAVNLFEGVYRENAYLRRRIRLMLKFLISETVTTSSGASLENLISFSERIASDFNDFLPLSCVWQACFLSEWFTDQCVALELLERHNGLCKSVINRIPYVVFISLRNHHAEVVYRLLEILLKYKMKHQYSGVLASLLDYQFRRGDLGRCAEVVRWAANNGVPLPKKQHIQMINLVLSQKLNTPLALIEEEEEKAGEKPKYDFRF